MEKYVLGFLFSQDRRKVALIMKRKPDWQRNKINGIGGKIEATDKDPKAAMVREFEEEAGVKITSWNHYATMTDALSWEVHVYKAFSDKIENVETKTDEVVVVYEVEKLREYRLLPNVHWLILLALDEEPQYTVINY